jgi:hypothetical protein
MREPAEACPGGVAKRARRAYLGPMSVFPPVSGPRALWADLKLFWSTRTRVQWIAGALAVLIPIGLGVAFWLDGRTNIRPGPTITYVKSWPANRTEADTRANIERVAAEKARRDEARRRDLQNLDNQLDRYGF